MAVEVLRPQDVLALMPSVNDCDSLVPLDRLTSWLPDQVRCPSGAGSDLVRPRPRLRPDVWLVDDESDSESAVPTVLV
jgi:hypothetical protein